MTFWRIADRDTIRGKSGEERNDHGTSRQQCWLAPQRQLTATNRQSSPQEKDCSRLYWSTERKSPGRKPLSLQSRGRSTELGPNGH